MEKTESDKGWRELKYNWCIDNFASLMNNNVGQGLVGDSFNIDSTKWHFVLHPNGTNQDSRHFVSLWLFNDNQEELSIEYQVFVGEKLLKSLKANKIKPGQGNGILKLVSHIQILEKNFLNEKGQLILTVKIYKDSENVNLIEKDNNEVIFRTFSSEMKSEKVLKTLSENVETPQLRPEKPFQKLTQNVENSPCVLAPTQVPMAKPQIVKLTSAEVVKSKVFLSPRDPEPIKNIPSPKIPSKTYSKKVPTPIKEQLTSSETPIKPLLVKKLTLTTSYIPAIPIPAVKVVQKSKSKNSIDLPKNSSSTVISPPLPKDPTMPKASNLARNHSSSFEVDKDNPDGPPEPLDDRFDPIMQTAGEISPDEPVAELLKIFKNLPSQDQILFIKLFVLQLNDEMLKLMRMISDSLRKESSFLTKTQKEIVKYEPNDTTADNFNLFEGEFRYGIDNVKEEGNEEQEIDIDEFLLEPSQVESKKLSIKTRESKVVEKQLTNDGEVSNLKNKEPMLESQAVMSSTISPKVVRGKRPWRFQSSSDLNDIQENEEAVNDDKKEGSDVLVQNNRPNSSQNIAKLPAKAGHCPAYNYSELFKIKSDEKVIKSKMINFNIFECSHCTDKFSSQGDLERHLINVERNKNNFQAIESVYGFHCSKCDEIFDSNHERNLHMRRHQYYETKTNMVCDQCGKTFETKSGWENHMQWHQEQSAHVKNIQCEQCPKMFHFKSRYVRHVTIRHTEATCKICETKCANVQALRIHMKKEHHSEYTKPKPFPCDQCSRGFRLENSLAKHKMQHINKPHHCSKCEKTFFRLDELKGHQAIHGNERKYECKECDKTFKYKSTLYKHVNVWHRTDLPFECDECSKRFPVASYLKTHKLRHLEDSQRPFICDQCGAGFIAKQELKVHLKNNLCKPGYKRKRGMDCGRATGMTITECNICGRPVKTKYLKLHLLTHMSPSERPKIQKIYQCELCDKSLKTSKGLKYHMKIHSSYSSSSYLRYSCEKCDKTFVSKATLRKHIGTHTKPFHCNECQKSFSTNVRLKEHLRTHTGIKPFSCDQCSKNFSSNGAVKLHKQRFHSDKLEASNLLSKIIVSTGI